MTDYAKLTGQPAAIDESLEAFEVKPEGFQNGKGKPLVLTMHPVGGTRFKKALRKLQIRVSRAEKDGTDEPAELTEAELDAELETADARSAELLARCCDGWNMTDGESPIPFSLDECKAMFSQLETLRSAVDEAITARGKELRAKKTA